MAPAPAVTAALSLIPLSLHAWLFATAVVALGALLQGSIGFGLGLIASPLLLLVDARLVPAPLLLSSGLLTILLTHRERRDVLTADLKWSLGGRVLGTGAALVILSLLSPERLGVVLGTLVLLGVALSVSGWHLPPVPRILVGAGLLSGFMGTIVSIGGPPIALVYQHESGPRIRGTLSAFFVVGVTLSLAGLAAVGRFGRQEIALGLALLPAILLGFLLSQHTARWLDRGYVRPTLLLVSGASAVAVIWKALR